ncbi:MAG: hypothetical protein ACJ8FY_23675 [Gemmataceae bacterium]
MNADQRDGQMCGRCGREIEYSGDWYGDLCPVCADKTERLWVCGACSRHGDFEEMGGAAAINPTCCGLACKHFQETSPSEVAASTGLPIRQFKLSVPTYNGYFYSEEVDNGTIEEFGDPTVPVLVHEADGVRVVLGTHCYDDLEKPDIQIERQPNGWMIFLHPLGGSDACGYVFFADDGRSFLSKEYDFGPTPAIQILEPAEEIAEINGPPPKPASDEAGPAIIVPSDPASWGP